MPQLCACSDIPEGTARGFTLGQTQYIAVNQDGGFHIYLNRCPHLGTPLEWQPDQFICPDTDLIRCATHGALFEPATGHCVYGPCQGQALTPISFEIDSNTIIIQHTE